MLINKEYLENCYQREEPRFIDEWKRFLEFKSISTDPAHSEDCVACAQWLLAHLKSLGFDGKLLDTGKKPVVFAERKGRGKARVLYYGHYDVQPVDPIELWNSAPFTATMKEGRLYARGAQDNKGQTFYVVKALETLVRADALDATVALVIEGEEECGSEGLARCITGWRNLLKADVLMVCDTGGLVPGVPFITMGLRGIISLEFSLSGPKHDLHSGALGGVVRNPATELARLIATLHDESGRISVPGYYEDVRTPSEADQKLSNRAWFGDQIFTNMIGVPPLGGERSIPPLERRGFRPTIEVNGIFSGYQGPGEKTIIPAVATAKLTSRLVAQQDPERCLKLLEDYLRARTPEGVTFTLLASRVGGPAVALPSEAPLIKAAASVLAEVAGREPEYTWEGGSIPIVSELAAAGGSEPLLVGFGLEEDRIHAPNESFSLAQFKMGFMYAGLMLQRLGSGAW